MSTNRFLSPVNSISNLSNGSANIYVSSVSCSNLTPSKAIKSNALNQLISTDLSISDVGGLQTALDTAISNPYIGTFEATNLRTENIGDVNRSITALQSGFDNAVYKNEPTTQSLLGDIQIPMGETSALIGQNLYDLNSTSNELLNKTVNIDNSTFTDYTKLNGNTQTGLLTVKRDDGAAVSENVFEIKNALNTVIYSVNGLAQHLFPERPLYSLQHPTDTRNIRFRVDWAPFGGQRFYSGISSVGFGAYNTELPVMFWTSFNGGAGQWNTNIVNFYANNIQMMRFSRSSTGVFIITINTPTISIPGTINSLTTVAGVFAQNITKTNTGSTGEQTLISTGIGNLTVPANTFKQGDAYCLKLSGLKTNANNDTVEIMLKSGANILGTTGSILLPALSNSPYDMKVYFTIRTLGILGTGLIHSRGFLSYTDAGAYRGADFTSLNTIDTTASNTLNIVSVQSDATNIITCSSLILSKIY